MNILLPLGNMPARGVLESTNTGFSAFTQPGWELKDISTKITNGMPDDDGVGMIKNAGETAIPDVCAHIQYLRTKLSEQKIDFNDEAVRAWMGVLAIIALSEEKNFQINVRKINLNGLDGLRQVYREALKKEHLLDEEDQLHVLTLFGNPIAILDIYPKIKPEENYRCFCYPFSTIDNPNEVMNLVKWFIPGEVKAGKRGMHHWVDVTGARQNIPYLSEREKALFAEWIAALKLKQGVPDSASIDMEGAVNQLIDKISSNISNHGKLISVETSLHNTNMRKENITAWRGALACVALSKFRGNDITLVKYAKRGQDDIAREVRLRHEGEIVFHEGRKIEGCLVYVCSDGSRIGMLDENLLIRPMYYCDPLDTSTIPWYRDDRWVEISDVGQLPEGEMRFEERGRLAAWYQEVTQSYSGENPTLFKALNDSHQDITTAMRGTIPIGKQGDIDDFSVGVFRQSQDSIPGKYNNITRVLTSVPDLNIPMPTLTEIFTDKLVLTMAEKPGMESELGISDPGINNTIVITSPEYGIDPEKFIALIPLKSSFVQCLGHKDDTLKLIDFSLTMKNQDQSIEAKIQIDNGGVKISKLKKYVLSRDVIYSAECPYLSLWPYIRSDAWKKYFVTCAKEPSAYLSSRIFKDEEIILEPMETSSATVDTVKMQNMDREWQLVTYDCFPEYIPMKTNYRGVEVEIGSIYVKLPEINHEIQSGRTYFASIDFGSSNTIVRLIDHTGNVVMDGQGEPYRIFTNKYVKPLTKWCAQPGNLYYESVKEFHEYAWLYYRGEGESGPAFWKNDLNKAEDRLPTVIQTYQGVGPASNEAPRYGRFLRSNCNVIRYFLAESEKKETSLETLGIKSNIKMSSMASGGTAEDGVIAIEHILIECALAAIDQDASFSYIVSYPDKKLWNSLRRYWQVATNNIRNLCSNLIVKGNVLKVTEIQSAHAYVDKISGNVNPNVGYAIIDIGGGTSDISLWLNDEDGNIALRNGLSLKYAGNQIVAETVFSFYRKLAGTGDAELQNFKNLWKIDTKKPDPIINMYEGMMEDGFKKLCSKNFSMATNMEYMRKQVPILSDTMIGSVGFSDMVEYGNPAVQPFIALLRAKVTCVFYVTAKMLEMSEAHDKGDPALLKAPYRICLAGNGAQALTMCGVQMDDFLQKMMQKLVKIKDKKFAIENNVAYRKTEVVMGMAALIAKASNGDTSNVQQAALGGVVRKRGREYVLPDDGLQPFQSVMWSSFNEYVEAIIKPYKDELFFVDGVTTIYDMLTLTNPDNDAMYYERFENAIKEAIAEAEPGTPLYIVAQIAAMKLVDYMLFMRYR